MNHHLPFCPLGPFSLEFSKLLFKSQELEEFPKLFDIADDDAVGQQIRKALFYDFINHLLDLIGNLPKMGTTVVLSSHQLYQVQRVCQSVGILAKGTMVIEGPLDKLSRDALTGGQYIIDIETAEPSPQLADIVKAIKGVIKVEVQGKVLRASTDTDLRAEIAKAVVQSNIPLVQMKVQEFSLDDIYMKYFHEG